MAGSSEMIVAIAAFALVAILLLLIFYVAPQIQIRHRNRRHTLTTGPTGPAGAGIQSDMLIVPIAATTGYGNTILELGDGSTGGINVLNAPLSIVLVRQGQLVTVNWPEIDFTVATGASTTIVQTPVGFVPAGWRPMAPAIFGSTITSPPHAYAFPPQTIQSPLFQTGGFTGIESIGRVRLVSDFAPDAGRIQWALDSSAFFNWPNDPQIDAIFDGGLTYVIP
jgi:hypothetical protein